VIAYLTGTVAAKTAGAAILDVNGVGYRLFMSTGSISALPACGDEVTVHTYLHVREDEMSLFGFESEHERELFEALLTVSGVGTKVALATLSALSPAQLVGAVTTQDVALLSSVPGVGKKTAQRIILELDGKLGASEPGHAFAGAAGAPMADAREALLAMGFTTDEISAALTGAPAGADVSQLVGYALKRTGGAK
jgi:Holliday junction DNA helicase RuvA